MKLSHFTFELPKKLIAQYPLPNREDARLMVVHRSLGTIEHHVFKDFFRFFESGDVLILNDTKVLSAQLDGYKEKTNSKIAVLLLRELDGDHHLWDVWIDPARKIRVGNKLCFGNELVAEVIDNTTSRGRTIKFSFDGNSVTLRQIFEQIGKVPIPKLLNRPTENVDKQRYQTVYASNPGSIAAPYAGLHFSPYLLKYLEVQGVLMPKVTLHLGAGTFKLMEAEELSKYKIHTEYYKVPESTVETVNKALQNKKRICAAGTSVLKAISSSISHTRNLHASEGWTGKFIHPPYEPEIANALLTNFHLPRSIDFINTLAFAGTELAMEIYEIAIEEEYSFFVYGDALLIL